MRGEASQERGHSQKAVTCSLGPGTGYDRLLSISSIGYGSLLMGYSVGEREIYFYV